MGLQPASNRHFTVSSERGSHVLHCAGSHYIRLFTSRKERAFYAKFFAVFREFLKITIARPSSIHHMAWKTTTKCMNSLLLK